MLQFFASETTFLYRYFLLFTSFSLLTSLCSTLVTLLCYFSAFSSSLLCLSLCYFSVLSSSVLSVFVVSSVLSLCSLLLSLRALAGLPLLYPLRVFLCTHWLALVKLSCSNSPRLLGRLGRTLLSLFLLVFFHPNIITQILTSILIHIIPLLSSTFLRATFWRGSAIFLTLLQLAPIFCSQFVHTLLTNYLLTSRSLFVNIIIGPCVHGPETMTIVNCL